MTAVVMMGLMIVSYMLVHWVYDAAGMLYRKGKKRLFLDAVQAGLDLYDTEDYMNESTEKEWL